MRSPHNNMEQQQKQQMHHDAEAPPSIVYTSPSTEMRKRTSTTTGDKGTKSLLGINNASARRNSRSPSKSSRSSLRRVSGIVARTTTKNKKYDLSSATVATSPTSVSTSSSFLSSSSSSSGHEGEEDHDSLSSCCGREQQPPSSMSSTSPPPPTASSSSSPSQRSQVVPFRSVSPGRTRRVRSIIRCFEETVSENRQQQQQKQVEEKAKRQSRRPTSSATKSEIKQIKGSSSSNPEYEARRNKRMQKIRTRRHYHDSSSSSLDQEESRRFSTTIQEGKVIVARTAIGTDCTPTPEQSNEPDEVLHHAKGGSSSNPPASANLSGPTTEHGTTSHDDESVKDSSTPPEPPIEKVGKDSITINSACSIFPGTNSTFASPITEETTSIDDDAPEYSGGGHNSTPTDPDNFIELSIEKMGEQTSKVKSSSVALESDSCNHSHSTEDETTSSEDEERYVEDCVILPKSETSRCLPIDEGGEDALNVQSLTISSEADGTGNTPSIENAISLEGSLSVPPTSENTQNTSTSSVLAFDQLDDDAVSLQSSSTSSDSDQSGPHVAPSNSKEEISQNIDAGLVEAGNGDFGNFKSSSILLEVDRCHGSESSDEESSDEEMSEDEESSDEEMNEDDRSSSDATPIASIVQNQAEASLEDNAGETMATAPEVLVRFLEIKEQNEQYMEDCTILPEPENSSSPPIKEADEDAINLKSHSVSTEAELCDNPCIEEGTSLEASSIPPDTNTIADIPPIDKVDDEATIVQSSSTSSDFDEYNTIPSVKETTSNDDEDGDDAINVIPLEGDSCHSNTITSDEEMIEDERSMAIPTQPKPLAQHEELKPSQIDVSSKTTGRPEAEVSSRKLKELRASKTELEIQLRHLVQNTSASSSLASSSSSHHKSTSSHSTIGIPTGIASHHHRSVDLIEPVVYDCMREELLKAYGTIAMQKKQLEDKNRDIPTPLPTESREVHDSALIAALRKQLEDLHREKAERELVLHHRLTNDAIEYKKTIDHWKRETTCWKNRFDSSWEDHEIKIRRMKTEKDDWKQRAIEAEQDLVCFKRGTEDTMLELIRAKERIHHLDEQLKKQPAASLSTPTGSMAPAAQAIISSDSESGKTTPEQAAIIPPTRKMSHQQASFLKDAMKRHTPKDAGRGFGRFTPWGNK